MELEMIPASFFVLFGMLAVDQLTREEGRGSARPLFRYNKPLAGGEVVLARAISVDLVELHKRGELDRYNAMRDFVDRSFSLMEFESDTDPAGNKSHQFHMWIFLPLPPYYQKKNAWKKIIEQWPDFLDPELLETVQQRRLP